MMERILYIHGKNGTANESRHFKPLFSGKEVIGLDYQTFSPWETGKEIHEAVNFLINECASITLIANSIGAYFCMHAGIDNMIQKAYFISPIVDMEYLIKALMKQADVTEEELEEKETIRTANGEILSWEYLDFVRKHPIIWKTPTEILYGQNDMLTPYEIIRNFAQKHQAGLTVMENGEHWFHTEEQIRFLDDWIIAHREEIR